MQKVMGLAPKGVDGDSPVSGKGSCAEQSRVQVLWGAEVGASPTRSGAEAGRSRLASSGVVECKVPDRIRRLPFASRGRRVKKNFACPSRLLN